MIRLVKIFCVLSITLTILIIVLLFVIDYNLICTIVSRLFSDSQKLQHFQEKYLSESKFFIARWSLIGFFLLLLSLEIVLITYRFRHLILLGESLRLFFHDILQWFIYFATLEKSIIRLLSVQLLLCLSGSIYYGITTPIFIDEAVTFLDFTCNSLFVTLTYYPQPNNHVLFSLLTNFMHLLPLDGKISMRLINIILSLLTNLLFFRYVIKFVSPKVGVLCTAVFGFLFMNLLYSFQARGYEIILLCSTIVFYSGNNFLQNNGEKKYLAFYSIASAVGFFAIPSFLYPVVTVTIFIMFRLFFERRYILIKQLTVTISIIGLLVFIEYLPIIFVSGLQSITGNYYTRPIQRIQVIERLFSHAQSTAQWLIGVSDGRVALGIIVLMALVLLRTIIIRKIKSVQYQLLLFSLVFAPIIIVIHSVIPFERTWVYLSIPICIASGVLVESVERFLGRKQTIYTLLLSISIGLFFLFGVRHREIYHLDYCIEELVNKSHGTTISSIGYDDPFVAVSFRFAAYSTTWTKPTILLEEIHDTSKVKEYDVLLLNNPKTIAQQNSQNNYKIIAKSECGTTFLERKK